MATSKLANTNLNFTNTGAVTGTFSFNNSDQFEIDKDVSVNGQVAASSLAVSTNGQIIATSSYGALSADTVALNDADSSDAVTLAAAAVTTAHTLTLPATQGSNKSNLRNDGSGALTWTIPQELALSWEASAMGDPTSNQPISNASFIGNAGASFISAQSGVKFTSSGNTNVEGAIEWNVAGFDFTNRDFELRLTTYQSGVNDTHADGIWFGVGGSASFSSGANTVNGGLTFVYNTFSGNNNTQFRINGSNVGNIVAYQDNMVFEDVWLETRMVVKTQGAKRYAFIFRGSETINGLDITSWVPGGTYIFVGGRNGAVTGDHWCRSMFLQYLD